MLTLPHERAWTSSVYLGLSAKQYVVPFILVRPRSSPSYVLSPVTHARPFRLSAVMNKIVCRPALWAASAFLVVLAAACGTTPVAAGLYNWKTSKVVQLTEKNFQSLVLDSKETWYVLVCVYCL